MKYINGLRCLFWKSIYRFLSASFFTISIYQALSLFHLFPSLYPSPSIPICLPLFPSLSLYLSIYLSIYSLFYFFSQSIPLIMWIYFQLLFSIEKMLDPVIALDNVILCFYLWPYIFLPFDSPRPRASLTFLNTSLFAQLKE